MSAFNVQDVQDGVLSGIRAGQEAVVGAVRTCVATAQAVTPKLAVPKLAVPKLAVPKLAVPKLAVPKLAVPKLAVPNVPFVPFADRLPRPEGVVARAYDFAEALLASQRKFAEELLAVLPRGSEDKAA